ncbi:MAG TPA: YdiU family protein [Pseudomonadales bacterium]|nr:YdiU family protein [Pseudomonadales bacterium]
MNTSSSRSPLERLRFDNRFVRELPADPEPANFRRQVIGASFSRVMPTPVAKPQLIAYSREVAQLLDLPFSAIESQAFAEVFAGNRVLDGMDPYATVYGGHQFGNWAGQLGDGRAINLGEVVNSRDEHWALQLKGAGPTPYSRTADGLAVLRSSIREFLCSEAMHHLGVPTTRALSLVATGEQVMRDMLYDGHPAAEPGAVVCRVAPSFTRFGHFEILAARGDVELLRHLADFTIRNEFPELLADAEAPSAQTYVAWFAEVSRRTVRMIVEWMRVGFVHGVMNTDNMSILGLTIDYGPYGWLEDYDPDWTPNTTDAGTRRYRYGQQPPIAQWNLLQLANAIYPLVNEAAPLEAVLQEFARDYTASWQAMMARKLGLHAFEADDAELFAGLDAVLRRAETDMPIFFRRLAQVDMNAVEAALLEPLLDAFYVPEQLTAEVRAQFTRWLREYSDRVRHENLDASARRAGMDAVNPKFVLRNYLAQLAIDAAEKGDYAPVSELLDVLRTPYAEQPEREAAFAQKRPDWARHRVGCSMLSCSS